MTCFCLHPNDAGITLLDREQIRYREPGMAMLDGERLMIGVSALRQARIDPRRVQHRFWSSLSTAPLTDRHFEHLSTADLVSQQLEEIWRRCAQSGDTLIVAAPAYLDKDRLSLLLGIASELAIPIVAMVDDAVGATRREYTNAVPVHIDIGLHTTSLSRLAQDGRALAEKTELLEDCGLVELHDTWRNVLAEAFVSESRFDPLHTAETEQMLADGLADWLRQAAVQQEVEMELHHGDLQHRARIESLQIIGAAAPFYQRMASQLRTLFRAGETPALQVTDTVAQLPGLTEMLKARVGGEVFALELGAAARGALARMRGTDEAAGPVSLRRQLPWDQSAFAVETAVSEQAESGGPTHLLFRHRAYRIGNEPLIVGTQVGQHERALVLDAEMPGISRRHCSVSQSDGRCIVEDVSRYGTFLNGHRIDGSTVLQIGDTLRVGSPGYELTLIATEEGHGA